jgi:hypothetical protein
MVRCHKITFGEIVTVARVLFRSKRSWPPSKDLALECDGVLASAAGISSEQHFVADMAENNFPYCTFVG